MSIEEKNVVTTAGEQAILAPKQKQPIRQWHTVLRSPLWLCLLLALLIRVWLIYHTQGVIDGDEAMVGIQAEHILRGEHPVYFYGQAYMGSLEAYLMAFLFALAGPSVWMLRAEPALLSLLVVYLTWRLAGALAETAHLPPPARQLFQTLAALFAALPPLYDAVLELRTLGGYIETFVLMLLLLLSALQLTRRWHTGASSKELALRWAGIGLIVGLGFWVNPLLVSAVLASAIWIIAFCTAEIIQCTRRAKRGRSSSSGVNVGAQLIAPSSQASKRTFTLFLQQCLLAITVLPASLVGAAPALYWGLHNHWANITYIRQLGDLKLLDVAIRNHYHSYLELIRAQIALYQSTVAPRVISGSLPAESAILTTIHIFTLYIGLLCLVTSLLSALLSLLWHHPILLRVRQLVALPLLFAACTAFTFCTSTITSSGLISPQHDLAGRYATPLMLVLPFFLATVFTLLFEKRYLVGAAWMWGTLSGRQALLFTILLCYLVAHIATFGLSDSAATFQSPSCLIAPANNDAIIAYLQQEHVQYGWADSWLANPIVFKTNDSIILADPHSIIYQQGFGRLPAYTQAVLHADHPAILTFVRHTEPYPPLLRILDKQQITYHVRHFPALRGYDVLVVTELSHNVSFAGSKNFAAVFPYCSVYQ